MRYTPFLVFALFLFAANLSAGEHAPFLAGVFETGARQNLQRTVSTDPRPVPPAAPRDRKASVSLKLPSLGGKKEGRMRIIEVEGDSDGSLNFDTARTDLTVPDIGIPGLVSPEILALDQYNMRRPEIAAAKAAPVPEEVVRKDDGLRRTDSLQPREKRPAVSYSRIEIPTAAPEPRPVAEPAQSTVFAPGSLKPPPVLPELPEPTPRYSAQSELAGMDFGASFADHMPLVPSFEWPPPAVVEPLYMDIPGAGAVLPGHVRSAPDYDVPAEAANGFTAMRELKNVLAPVYRNANGK